MHNEWIKNKADENIATAENHLEHLKSKRMGIKRIRQTHYWKGY